MSANNLDEVLESGNEAAIEAALAEMDATGDILFAEEGEVIESEVEQEAQPETQIVQEATSESENDVVETDSSPAQEQDAEVKKPIARKNGEGTIPYGVLDEARKDANTSKAALKASQAETEVLRRQVAESNQMKSLYGEQLKEAGIELGMTPEQMLQDPSVMEQFKADYPGIGDAVAALAAQIKPNQPELQEEQSSTQEEGPSIDVQDAFNASSHLKDWQANDVDRWALAQQVDERLANDPSFANKTMTERFTEVEKRVMTAFGDETPAQVAPKKAIQPDITPQSPIPNSPSDIGHQGSDLSKNSQLLSKSAAEMTADFASMSDADIEAALAEASDFL